MKYLSILSIIFVCIFISSCNTHSISYIHYNWNEDYDFEFFINQDSTFVLQDNYGCIRYYQCGKWKDASNDSTRQIVLLCDTMTAFTKVYTLHMKTYNRLDDKIHKIRYYFTDEYLSRPIIKDTIIINGDTMKWRGHIFHASKKYDEELKFQQLEDEYIQLLGKELFIEYFGKGKGLRYAKRNLRENRSGSGWYVCY